MGKSRRNRSRAQRSDPIAKPVKPLTDPELISIRESRILPIVKDLQSADPRSRTTAAGAIANIVQDAKCRKLLLREQIVHIVLTETLTDNSLESRVAGWEILRVLAQEEESDFCVHLHRLDILTAIEHAGKLVVDSVNATEPPFGKTPKAQQRAILDMAAALVSLLTALATARDETLEAIVRHRAVLRFLFVLATNELTPQDLVGEVLSCILTLSEDNTDFGQAAVDDRETRIYDLLLKLKDGLGLHAVLACGILHNIFVSLEWQDHRPGKDGACDALLVPAVTRVLSHLSQNQGASNGSSDTNPYEIMQLALEVVASIGTDLQDALEAASHGGRKSKNQGAQNGLEDGEAMDEDESQDEDEDDADGDDSEAEDDGDEDGGEDAETGRDDMDADMELVTGPDTEGPETADLDDAPTLKELIQKAVPQLVQFTQTPLESDEAIALQGHALAALNNIAWTISCLDFTGEENAGVYRIWAPAAKSIWSQTVTPILTSDTADVGLATSVTSLAWALARSLGGTTPLAGDEHRRFMALYQASGPLDQKEPPSKDAGDVTHDPLQSIGVKCIGVLGQLARDPAPLERNREIGIFLITVLTKLPETPAADAIEALNQMFDIYGDESFACEAVFWQDKFMQHLEEIAPRVKSMAKSIDKRKFGELRSKADEAVVNLGRFLRYKKKHAP
ncbi:hypothetical protein VTK73DRAFT_6749 [Phialemonium thermophilum]|uniref:SYO1-like TPR repeats domain-containing protein n=1 Tax=Phialemonium thermophilum TaxID=223376 RepID=A0ABR3WHZ1_9PEZI